MGETIGTNGAISIGRSNGTSGTVVKNADPFNLYKLGVLFGDIGKDIFTEK